MENKKRIASLGLVQDTRCLGLVHWDDPEGCYGKGASGLGTHVYLWRIHADVWQNQYNIVKQKKKRTKKKKEKMWYVRDNNIPVALFYVVCVCVCVCVHACVASTSMADARNSSSK